MTEQNIPAEKVRELKAKYEYDTSGNPERLLADLLHDLDALLPVQQPTSGLLGRWAKHEEYGDVVCMWDRPDPEGNMHVRWVDESFPVATGRYYVPLSDLTFPEQTTKPEEVPAGEAWLVDVDGEKYNAVKTTDRFPWWFFNPEINTHYGWGNSSITLIAPLTPERPGTDLQAKYDALDAKYREAREKIKTLEQPSPVWRIEHDWRNLRGDEYIIDKNGDPVVTETKHWAGEPWYTDSLASVVPEYARFIVFPNKDAATPEAIEEAMKERDKERE